MVGHNLAARSLRHLRFARRVMAGQPLLARVFNGHHASAYVSLDGYQLPVGRVLRRLPLSDSIVTESAAPGDSSIDDGWTPPVETALRLLPRLPEYVAAAADTPADSATWQAPPAVSDELPTLPTLPIEDTQPPARAPMRPDGRRPHSRIVELPGVVSLPVAEEASEEDAPLVAQADAPPETDADSGADVAPDAQSDDYEQPSQPLPALDELPAVVRGEPASAPAVEMAPVPAPRRRGGKRAVPTPPTPPTRASDALFPPTDADRTPQSWLARLRQAETPTLPYQAKPDGEPPMTRGQPIRQRGQGKAGPTPGVSYAPAQLEPAATPALPVSPASPVQAPTAVERPATLPDSSRATLRTMTGVDPAGVRIYRGPLAERVTATQNADALTDGGAIALGAGHTTDTPETLGLLAHELTHVAQRRAPRFVPPIAQAPQPQSQPAMSPADEESQAGWVEARVTNIVRTRSAAPIAAQQPLAEQSAPGELPSRERSQRDNTRDMWGNLPAPWEPLPAWLTNPASTPPPMSSFAPAPAPQSAQRQLGQPASTPAPSADVPDTQRAERGRSLPDAEGEARHAATAHEGDMPEPDLDALAQQVHAILKRRLAAERRRFG